MSDEQTQENDQQANSDKPQIKLTGVTSYDVVVEGMVRDGANTWLASLSVPSLGLELETVYLHGTTEEEAYQCAVEMAMSAHANMELLAQEGVSLMEAMGEQVRVAWVEWAKGQPDPKPHWLTPWAELAEPDKEADRRIASHLVLWLAESGHYRSAADQMKAVAWKMAQTVAHKAPEAEPTDAEITEAIGDLLQDVVARSDAEEAEEQASEDQADEPAFTGEYGSPEYIKRMEALADNARDNVALYMNALCDVIDAYDEQRAKMGEKAGSEPVWVQQAREMVTPLILQIRREQRQRRQQIDEQLSVGLGETLFCPRPGCEMGTFPVLAAYRDQYGNICCPRCHAVVALPDVGGRV